MFELTTIVAVTLTVATVALRRGLASAVSAPIALLGVASTAIATFVDMHAPLLGWAFVDVYVLVGVPLTLAVGATYIALTSRARTRFGGAVQRPTVWLAAIMALALATMAIALVVGRGRPQPSLDGCARAAFTGLDNLGNVDLDLSQSGYRVTGTYMTFDENHNGATCELAVTHPSGKEEHALLAPPYGLSGEYRCGRGEVALCTRSGLLLVEEDEASLGITSIHGFRLSPTITPVEPSIAASAPTFAPPRGLIWFAVIGSALAAFFAAGPLVARAFALVRRIPWPSSSQPGAGPYRAAAAPETPVIYGGAPTAARALLVMRVPTAGVIALMWLSPLVIALCLR